MFNILKQNPAIPSSQLKEGLLINLTSKITVFLCLLGNNKYWAHAAADLPKIKYECYRSRANCYSNPVHQCVNLVIMVKLLNFIQKHQ